MKGYTLNGSGGIIALVCFALLMVATAIAGQAMALALIGAVGVVALGAAAHSFRKSPTAAFAIFLACGLFVSQFGFSKVADILAVAVLIASLVAHPHKQRIFQGDRATRFFFFAMVALTIIATAITIKQGNFSDWNSVYIDARNMLYWLVLPVGISVCSYDGNRWHKLLTWIVTLFAGIALLQFVLGVGVVGRTEELETLGTVHSNVTRATSPANYFCALFVFVTVAVWAHYKRLRLRSFFVALMAIACLVVSFGRGYWFTTAAGIFVVFFFARPGAKIRMMFFGAVSILLIVIAAQVYSSDFVDSLVERFTSVGAEVKSGQSLGWREIENDYAMRAIIANPLRGAGIGVPYKPALIDDDNFGTQRIYIHNTYYGLVLKLGVFGLIVFAWYLLVLMRRIIRILMSRKYGWLGAAYLASIMQFLAASVTQPAFTTTFGITFFCFLAVGVSITYRQLMAERRYHRQQIQAQYG
ncbi:hypothetical protein LMG31506_02997 [Cupriavidus yeoncheonensis]|uniref:O-antigen ligase-related domain-containing protein n=1 Tax=Cupriavidus yeoncheonensis TaxID=1462994 RepID=A0A916ITA7_9BURK|nr:O-antigen ligase family protein [Cupriavidus yeoncheonensis]CAG2144398.1 hypothetical protein LMG31506_02997 [Cupriavidus yeoncheonensis]